MPEPFDTTSELSVAISNVLTALKISMMMVVKEVSTELAYFAKQISLAVSYNIIDLIDEIFNLYSYEWVKANRKLQEIDNWIDTLIYAKVGDISETLNTFNTFTDILIQRFAEQLEEIDLGVSPEYNKRMFAVYGRIAELSVAIEAPPSYLEEAIQNARFFAMSLACSSGLSYYQFQLEWDDKVENLLIRIGNSINLYRQQPQYIKVDIDYLIIRPLYEIEKNRRTEEREFVNFLDNDLILLANLVSVIEMSSSENKQAISSMFELQIAPKLKEIIDSFNNWEKDTYDVRMKSIQTSFVSLFIQIVEVAYEAIKILKLLDYGGDLLLRVDKLSEHLRLDQEDKISDVTTRSFRRLVPQWLSEVEKRIG